MSDANYIKAKLESAGRTMMMLPATGTRPKGYASGWPEIVRDFADMIEAPKENTPPPMRATMQQMNELETVEGWIVHLAAVCREKRIPWVAKAVALSSLRWPSSERPVFTWSKLGRKMGVSPTAVRNWYDQGVEMIRTEIAIQARTGSLNGSVVPLRPKKE